jgi:hypothetical protein
MPPVAWGLGDVVDHDLSLVEGFRSLFSLLLSVFFQDGEAATMS